MKLHEAIRLGAMNREQAFNSFFDRSGRSCAWGAACEAIGAVFDSTHANTSHPQFREWSELSGGACPICGQYRPSMFEIVTHLNDKHHWTRERIADYVETIERAPDAELPQRTEVLA
jgi:hypothetical protein